MKVEDKNILLISPENWNHIFVSKHHYALELSKKNTVYFLNPPAEKFSINKLERQLYVVADKNGPRGLRFLPKKIAAIVIAKQLRRLERKVGLSFDIIWSFDPGRFFNLSEFNCELKIAHIADLNQEFQRDQLCETSDLVLCVSYRYQKILSAFNRHCYRINHGYQISKKSDAPFELNRKFEKHAAYIGNLTYRYIDWAIIETLVLENENVHFYFVGPLDSTKLDSLNNPPSDNILDASNATFMGRVDSKEIPPILNQMDILFLAYKEENQLQMSNSHKILEYLGSGKVTVSSYIDDYKNSDHLQMVSRNSELPDLFRQVANNLEEFNSQSNQSKRMTYAESNSYANQLIRIQNLLPQE